jgi:hypothetical protein
MVAALAVFTVGTGVLLARRSLAGRLVRSTGFLLNRPLDPDRVAAGLGAAGLGVAAFGVALALGRLLR